MKTKASRRHKYRDHRSKSNNIRPEAPPATPMRVMVLEALQKVNKRVSLGSFWYRELSNLPVLERPLAHEILTGVLRNRGCLDRVVSLLTEGRKCSPWLVNILRLGLYQLHFNDKVTDYAAIDQSVRLAKQYQPKAAPLVNAVLRRFVREAGSRSSVNPWGDLPVIPDPGHDLCDFLAVSYSHPRWLVKRWLKRFGKFNTERLCLANQQEPPVVIRLNRLRLENRPEDRALLMENLRESGYEPAGLELPMEAVELKQGCGLSETEMFVRGWFLIQSIPSMLACLALAPRPGEKVLDLCAGRGGKTWYLVQLMRNQGELYPHDISWRKLEELKSDRRRLGVSNLRFVSEEEFPKGFDRILVDAPCSSLGILGRQPDIRWIKSPEDIKECSKTQYQLLLEAAEHLRPGGQIVYSVCSFEPEENEEVINRFLETRPNFKIESLRTRLPEKYQAYVNENGFFRSMPHKSGCDGFFIALLSP